MRRITAFDGLKSGMKFFPPPIPHPYPHSSSFAHDSPVHLERDRGERREILKTFSSRDVILKTMREREEEAKNKARHRDS